MKKAFTAAFAAFALLLLVSSARAETVSAGVIMSPLNEIPPITLNAQGGTALTVVVQRDASGNIVGGAVNFLTFLQFPGSVTVVGLHVHEGSSLVNAPIVIATGISGTNNQVFASGNGLIQETVMGVSAAVLGRLLANPSGFYVNLHTTVNTGGAIRGQITKLVEAAAVSTAMSTANEVPPITAYTASATGTVTVNPTRNPATGAITGGTVTFSVTYDFPGAVTFTGLHIHEGASDVNAPVVINTGISATVPVVSESGKGMVNFLVPVTNAALLGRLLTNPASFYINLHSTVNTGGAVRAQLTPFAGPPVIALSNTYLLPTGNQAAPIGLLAPGIDLASVIVVNGAQIPTNLDLNTGNLVGMIPASLLANAGVLFVQARNSQGLLSRPINVVVAAAANTNATAVASVDAAGFGRTSVAPDSIAAAFGTRLASQLATPTGATLPTTLDGTSVYVNGVAAPLFFVSPGQINYLVPGDLVNGPARVVVTARDGTVSSGQVLITNTGPGIFTFKADGTGAPSAVASRDNGATFPVFMSNANGTPVEIEVGNIVLLFGTGIRFRSNDATMTAGGVQLTPSFAGAQSTLVGLDQINLTIPEAMRGKGEVDLVLSVDGKNTNAVRIRVR